MSRLIIHGKQGVRLEDNELQNFLFSNAELLNVHDTIEGRMALVSANERVLQIALEDHPNLTYSPEVKYRVSGNKRFVSKEEMYASAPTPVMLTKWQDEMDEGKSDAGGTPTSLDDMVEQAFRAQFDDEVTDEESESIN